MSETSLILLGAGSSSRFGLPVKKQWLYQGEIPLWLYVAQQYEKNFNFKKIIITAHQDEINYMKQFASYHFVAGGSNRQESLNNALKVVDSEWVLVNDIARCCLDKALIERIFEAKDKADCIVPALKAVDTVYYKNNPIEREDIRLIQTPQLSKKDILEKALESKESFTDESSAINAVGGKIHFVEGSIRAKKLTYLQDLKQLECLTPPTPRTLVGYGLDIHSFEEGKTMVLGGVKIESPFGFKAHSDGDVAIHALIDALLGACGMGDIGEYFPDNDPKFKNANSIELLKDVLKRIHSYGFEAKQVDLTILAQTPRLSPYKDAIRKNLAKEMQLLPAQVNIKATTAEEMGFVGRKEGVTVYAIATLGIYDWKKNI